MVASRRRDQRGKGGRSPGRMVACILDPLFINLLITAILYAPLLFVLPLSPSLISSLAFLTLALYMPYTILASIDWIVRYQLVVYIMYIQERISLHCAFIFCRLPLSRGTRFHLFGFTYVTIYWLFWIRVFLVTGVTDVDLLVALPFLLLWLRHTCAIYELAVTRDHSNSGASKSVLSHLISSTSKAKRTHALKTTTSDV
jgi:hypothetical protein